MTASDSPPLDRPSTSGTTSRPRALLVCVALFAASAVLIAVDKRGVLDGVAQVTARMAGLTLGASGGLLLLYVWGAGRFRFSIGRLMALVALVAVFLGGILALRQWISDGSNRQPAPPGSRNVR